MNDDDLFNRTELTGFDKLESGMISESRSMPSSRRNSGNQTGGPLSPYPPINRNHSACTLTGAYGSGSINPNASNLNAPTTITVSNTLNVTGQSQLGQNLHPGMAQTAAVTAGASLSTGHLTVARHGSFSGIGLSDTQVNLQTSLQGGSNEQVPITSASIQPPSHAQDRLITVRSSSAVNQDHVNAYLLDMNNNHVRRKSSTALSSIVRNNRVLSNFRANSEPNENESITSTDAYGNVSKAHPLPQTRPSSVISGPIGLNKLDAKTEIERRDLASMGRSVNRVGPRLSCGISNLVQSDLSLRRRAKPLSISANSCSSSDDMSSDDDQRPGSAGLGSSSSDACNSGKVVGEIKLSFVMTKGLLEIEIIAARGLALNQNKTAPGQSFF